MCRRATARAVFAACLAALPWCVQAADNSIGWRRIGNSAIELGLPSLATGPVDRVWYSSDGSSLYAKTASGRIFQTSDFEQWQLVADAKIVPPAEEDSSAVASPEPAFKLATGRT